MTALGLWFFVLCWAVAIVVVLYFVKRGNPSAVNLLPYQRGVLFRKGRPFRDVGPGKHRVWTGTELLVHADTRPISVAFENQIVALRDGFAALYGFSASAQIRDLRKALYSARDYTQVPPFILLRCARRELNFATSTSLRLEKEAAAQRISDTAKSRLAALGFDLLSFRLTQLQVGTQQSPTQSAPQPTNSTR
jgi:regulator of protease activity HflC (stomatin/prohibitin superfamily)